VTDRPMHERVMTPDKLRTIADWLDVYDAFAREVAPHLNRGRDEILAFTDTVSGTEAQDDLRLWADWLEANS
jgi:hypothetical protein